MIGARAQQFLQARLQPFCVALQYRAAVKLHRLDGFAQMDHALAQFMLNASAFLLAHLIQAIEHLARSRHHRRLDRIIVRILGRIERARNAQDDVEIGFCGTPNSPAANRKAAM